MCFSGKYQGLASHALPFMLTGTSGRWKQLVAHHMTGSSTEPEEMKIIIFELIRRAEEIGLRVNNITSDMGGSNLAIWKTIGVGRERKENTFCNSIEHPEDSSRRLYVFADVPHLLKNLSNALLNNGSIKISPLIQEKYKLTSESVELQHLENLLEFQEKSDLKLAPKLREYILHPKGFEKMKVGTATSLFNSDTVHALQYLAFEKNCPEYDTSAWFINMVSQWWIIMKSRHPCTGINANNDTINFLTDFLDITREIKIGRMWKPVQTGIIMSTTSAIQLSTYLMHEKDFK